MNKILRVLFSIAFVVYGVVDGMSLDTEKLDWRNDVSIARLNWADIASRTHPADISSSDMTRRYLEGDKTVDWNDILNDAIAGHPIAQFCIAERCNGSAKLSYNGQKKNFQTAMGMFILISAQKGAYSEAQSYLKERMPHLSQIDLGNERAISEFIDQFRQNIEGR